ncbi:hypothetical protein BG004_001666, partial [Podila humilis]
MAGMDSSPEYQQYLSQITASTSSSKADTTAAAPASLAGPSVLENQVSDLTLDRILSSSAPLSSSTTVSSPVIQDPSEAARTSSFSSYSTSSTPTTAATTLVTDTLANGSEAAASTGLEHWNRTREAWTKGQWHVVPSENSNNPALVALSNPGNHNAIYDSLVYDRKRLSKPIPLPLA